MSAPEAVTRKSVEYQKAWRKVAHEVAEGYNFTAPGVAMIDELKDENKPVGRENLLPVDLNEEAGVATIDEAGMEAYPSSVSIEEGLLTFSEFNARFNVPLLVEALDQGSANQIERQLTLQGSKKVQAMGAHIDDYLYGSSSAVLALTNTDIGATSAGGTVGPLTLTAAYGRTGVTDVAFIVDKIKVGDRVALINSDTLVGVILVTARSKSAGTITGTAESAISATTADGLKIVKANQMPAESGRTITQTDYNRGLVGFADMFFANALHSLTHENWSPALTVTTAGRFTGAKLRRANFEIGNWGGGKITDVWLDQYVYNDMVEQERAALRVDDPMAMEIDGSVKSRGRRFYMDRRVPPGDVYTFDRSALRRWDLFKSKTSFAYGDGKEYINQAAMVFRLSRVLGLLCRNRKNLAVFTNQTRATS